MSRRPAGRFTPKQSAALGSYCRDMADLLGLRDWTVRVVHEPVHSTQPELASCSGVLGRRFADLRFAPEIFEIEPEMARLIVAHELIHCHVPARPRNDLGLVELLGAPAATIFQEAENERLELAVDALGEAIAPFLPLPPWAKKGKAKKRRDS